MYCVCNFPSHIINLWIYVSMHDETQHWCNVLDDTSHTRWQHTRTWLIDLIYAVNYVIYTLSPYICMLTYILTGPQVKVWERVDTLIYHPSIIPGLDNISVPHPPGRFWSTDTPLAAWILPGRTSASGSVWTSWWNPVGLSVDLSDRSAMLRQRPELRESPPTARGGPVPGWTDPTGLRWFSIKFKPFLRVIFDSLTTTLHSAVHSQVKISRFPRYIYTCAMGRVRSY